MMKHAESWSVRFDNWLWKAEHQGDSPLLRMAWRFTRIIFAVIRDFIYGDMALHAMGLVYTTILSFIPFLALAFSVLTALGVHNQLEPLLENFLEPLGERAPVITDNVLQFVDNIRVGVLGFAGMGFLIYTVISLTQKIETAFNSIWRVSQLRSLGQRFSNYLSVIIIGPVLIVSALGTTGTIVGSDFVTELRQVQPFGWLFSALSQLTPFFVIIGLFTFLYVFIPNTRVRVKYAFLGGVVAGVIWQATSLVFANFVAGSTRYEAIYSSFVVGILFLWWLYLAWLILLVGSSVAFYAQHEQQITRSRRLLPSASVDERTGLSMMYRVAREFDTGGGATSIADMESNLSVGPEVIERMTRKLIKRKLLVNTSDGAGLLPARSLDKITLTELMQAVRAPETPMPPSIANDKAVCAMADLVEDSFQDQVGGQTVADWVRNTDEGAVGGSARLVPDSAAASQ
ncbi:YihY/virulence factor BrkB family protein [Gilvimarinus sp. F26214L]|uniref:YihY/virulence factor BrkB family protein n=1 Tax=Gilvimarinus sp. DZF01 TaxID=3461371 RepID=UPI004045FC24